MMKIDKKNQEDFRKSQIKEIDWKRWKKLLFLCKYVQTFTKLNFIY